MIRVNALVGLTIGCCIALMGATIIPRYAPRCADLLENTSMAFYDYVKQLIGSKGKSSPQPKAPTNNPSNVVGVQHVPNFNSGANYGASTGNSYVGILPTNSDFNRGASYGSSTGNTFAAPLNPNYVAGQSQPANSSLSVTGGGGTAGQPDLSMYRNDVLDKLSQIQSAYDSLFSGVDETVRDKVGQANQNYDLQASDLNRAFQQNSTQQSQAYGARGLTDSSYLQNAQQDSKDIYNSNQLQIDRGRQETLGGFGQYAATTKAQLGQGQGQYGQIRNDINNYDQATLQGLSQRLGGDLGNLQTQRAGLGTNASFVEGLNKITPTQNTGANQLASKLQQLVTSSAPRFAKEQIAQGLVKQAQIQDPQAQSYWSNYFKQLLGAGA